MVTHRLWRLHLVLVLLGAMIAVVWIRLVGGFEGFAGLSQVRPLFVVVMLALTAASVLVRFLRWHFLLRHAGVRLPTRPSLLVYLASLVGMATPAYIGEAVRGGFLRARFGVPVKTTLFVLVLERLLDVIVLAVLAMVTANSWLLFAVMALILTAASIFAMALRSIAQTIGVSGPAIASMRRRDVMFDSLGLSVVAWLLAAFHLSFAASSLHLWISPIASARTFSSAVLLGGLTLMPAGIGATGSLAILQIEKLGLSLGDGVLVVALLRLTTVGATLVVGAICFFFELRTRSSVPAADAAIHFDEIAAEYGDQFRRHIWDHLLDRKVGLIADALGKPSAAGRGLDLGCGLGSQCLALARRGYRVFGMDLSRGLVKRARAAGASVAAGSALALPFRDSSLDYVYAVGVLHHLPDRQSQQAAYAEIGRVLRPGGRLLVHETNPRNPLFRLYMGYVFPLLKKIDEGTEWWIEPERWTAIPSLKLVSVQFFTFMPDFIPAWLMKPVLAIDRRLEASRLRRYSVHYMAVIERDPSWSAAFVSEPVGEDAARPMVAVSSAGQ